VCYPPAFRREHEDEIAVVARTPPGAVIVAGER
jgi:hypothetical protein